MRRSSRAIAVYAGLLLTLALAAQDAPAQDAAPNTAPPKDAPPKGESPQDAAPEIDGPPVPADWPFHNEGEPEATSLIGEPLFRVPMSPEDLSAALEAWKAADRDWRESPDSVEANVRVGRCASALGHYQLAVWLYSLGLGMHPDEPHLLRHRGHRYITLRRFDLAVADLERAAALVKDQPDEPEPGMHANARGVVLDTFHENIHYHLALAHYLRGEYEAALPEWQATGRCVTNDDGRAMVAHWTWLTLQRLGRPDDAAAAIASITPEMDIVEYHDYHDAVLVYRGLKDPDVLLAARAPTGETSVNFATLGYGVARWHLAQGRTERGEELLRRVAAAAMWAAFGRIAAEADVAREDAGRAKADASAAKPGAPASDAPAAKPQAPAPVAPR